MHPRNRYRDTLAVEIGLFGGQPPPRGEGCCSPKPTPTPPDNERAVLFYMVENEETGNIDYAGPEELTS